MLVRITHDMAFQKVNISSFARFNSGVSSELLDLYEQFALNDLQKRNSEPSSKTFAPSSFRCSRRSWFRLRGTEPDSVRQSDRALDFTAMVGTACHSTIQSLLISLSNNMDPSIFEWVPLDKYLESHPIPYDYTIQVNGYETQFEIKHPYPIKFACDGIVRYKGKYYLLEIKTCELSSFQKLTSPKPHHLDQVKCYCTLLKLQDVWMIYQERQFGGIKSFTHYVSLLDMDNTLTQFDYVMDCVASNIAPRCLPTGDPFCNGCPYTTKCSQWGRFT